MSDGERITRRIMLRRAGYGAIGAAAAASGLSASPAAAAASSVGTSPPLRRIARRRGLIYGSSTATWQIADAEYRRLFAAEAGMLFTEDDLLWYRLRPTPDSDLDFTYGDRIVSFAERLGIPVFGAHLVWDQGFGDGWTDDDLWGLTEGDARTLLFGTVERVVRHYRGRVAAWSVVNEAISPEGGRGLRTDVPWYATIGRSYVEESFRLANAADPRALLVLNDFGYETVNRYGDRPEDKRRATLRVLDELLGDGVPVQALGIQAHLLARDFAERFDVRSYRRFLSDVAQRGLRILITELDVLDSGLPAQPRVRDRMVADVYRRYLDAALAEPAVAAVMTFGLSDRYTWLQEDYPRRDGARRRPLPFDRALRPKPAYDALAGALRDAPSRTPVWVIPRELHPGAAAGGA
jgi:endo-1,4-beta-xylanase